MADKAPVDVVVPSLGESISEATVGRWLKNAGDVVEADAILVELETEKVTQELKAPVSGVLKDIVAPSGSTVAIGAVLAHITPGAVASQPTTAATPPAPSPSTPPSTPQSISQSPAVRRLATETGIKPETVKGTGPGGRVTKGDMLVSSHPPAPIAQGTLSPTYSSTPSDASETRVPMSKLRQTIATRLKQAQETAAILTTFNDVDMSNIMALRAEYKASFEKKHGVKLGFMGFFVKACVAALQEQPIVNAQIEGTDVVYKNTINIGVAVGTEKGLVVPVIRGAEHLSLPEIEKAIGAYAVKARDGKLTVADLKDGTFTISNGGVYGSLLSTPILNAPQSAVLGMHRTEDRPVAHNGQVVIRPMMYLALSYDHRLIDGKEAVTFLAHIKGCLENPARLIVGV
jgi:2-oxoglutarate dehydrogenase E2 component (dihydrolipoamide succinyltransferase)